MITKTLICDVCNSSVGELELYNINFEIRKEKEVYFRNSVKKDVCKKCLNNKNLLIITPESEKVKEKIEANTKTIETKFIELLEDLGVQFQE